MSLETETLRFGVQAQGPALVGFAGIFALLPWVVDFGARLVQGLVFEVPSKPQAEP